MHTLKVIKYLNSVYIVSFVMFKRKITTLKIIVIAFKN
jgi:hypothetical protein